LGDKEAFRFVPGHCGDGVSLTYRALQERAMAIGGELQASIGKGGRALLLFPPGLDFVASFLGCLYAGVVAVPVALPARNRSTSSIEAILNASNPAVILSTADHCNRARQSYAHLRALHERPWIATDTIGNEMQYAWRDPQVDGRQIALLQYTSGSTSSPKGVILSHDNVLSNAALIQRAFGNTQASHGVFWLPQYHDMGLIGGIIQPIYCGGSCTLLAPAAFLQRPALWLETISRTQATVSGGPDFAYGLCVRKISAEDRRDLDLSSWKVAFTGAERIRAETIEQFTAAFAGCGFRRESFFPCYGLAEATLMLSGGPRQTAPNIIHVQAGSLATNQIEDAAPGDSAVRTLVGCGECLPGQTIAIVDPQTRRRLGEAELGEIWGQGRSIAAGYYGCPEATRAAFGGTLINGEGPFLRTGDIGFLRGGRLFVTGRLKDLIILRGRNYFPEDIEHSVAGAHPTFRIGYTAAFSVDFDDRERLVVIQEIKPRERDLDAEAALWGIRRVIATEFELEVYAIVLVKAGEIPKTSSGKTQRSVCRERYLSGQLTVIAQWTANGEAAYDAKVGAEPDAAGTVQRVVAASEAENWLIRRIAASIRVPPAQIQVTTPFIEFGMSSMDAVEIAAELERWLGRRISPTATYNYPNIAALARWLANPEPEQESPARLHLGLSSPGNSLPVKLLDDVRNMTEEDIKAFILREMSKQ
jgi:acyl-CoA synthetase (AMP-forming)/AMP-acid ligase II/acyl carrier protein